MSVTAELGTRRWPARSAVSRTPLAGVPRSARVLVSTGTLAALLILWEMLAAAGWINDRLLPPPSRVWTAGVELAVTGRLWLDLGASLRRSASGFLIGAVAGVFTGLVTGRILFFRLLLEPVLQMLRPIPGIAWVPFAILWFGVGESPKIFLIGLGVVLPVWLNTHIGVMATPARYIETAQSVGIRGLALFARVVLPAALPFIVAGLRQGLALAVMMLVAAEQTGASSGIGYLISSSHTAFRTDRMFVGLILIGSLGALADFLFTRLTRRVVHWERAN